MKNLVYLSLMLLAVLLSACEKDEPSKGKRPPLVPGKSTVLIVGEDGSPLASTRAGENRVEFTGGYATGAGLYDGKAQAIVSAHANPGYQLFSFTGGPINGDPNQFNGKSEYTFDINSQDWKFKVIFKKEYLISLSSSAGGQVSGGGTFLEDATCTLSATADPGYEFEGWYENNTKFESSANYSFVVSSGRTIRRDNEKIKSYI